MIKLPTLLRMTCTSVLLASAFSAQATPLNLPTGNTFSVYTTLNGTTSAARPELAGTVLADVQDRFSLDGLNGTVESRVVRENGAGTLDFYWAVSVDASTPFPTPSSLTL